MMKGWWCACEKGTKQCESMVNIEIRKYKATIENEVLEYMIRIKIICDKWGFVYPKLKDEIIFERVMLHPTFTCAKLDRVRY